MLLPQTHYPSMAQITTLEELLLTLARAILSNQKNTTSNPNSIDIIDISTNEETEKISININGLRGRVNSVGTIIVSELFNSTFATGTGNYPFNRAGLCDAFFHLAMYQSSLEKDTEINLSPETNQFISVSISTSDSPTSNPLLVDISVTDYPLTLTYQEDGGLVTEAKPYLS